MNILKKCLVGISLNLLIFAPSFGLDPLVAGRIEDDEYHWRFVGTTNTQQSDYSTYTSREAIAPLLGRWSSEEVTTATLRGGESGGFVVREFLSGLEAEIEDGVYLVSPGDEFVILDEDSQELTVLNPFLNQARKFEIGEMSLLTDLHGSLVIPQL